MKYPILLFLVLVAFACGTPKVENAITTDKKETSITVDAPDGNIEKIKKSKEEWKAELDELEYYVLREKGTERSFTGDLWDNKEKGVYTCRGCQLPLFHSSTKFKSGTGWPSYYQPINKKNVVEKSDYSHGMTRTEVLCGRCDGHLGHVFDDGPAPTGLRYCINSVSMDFVRDSL